MTGKQHIIVVDDDADVRDSMRVLLEANGFQVQCYASAHRLLEEPLPPHACLVTDVCMPDMTGLELLEELTRRQASLPVVVITGHGDVPLAVRAMKAGAVDFIEKPVDANLLIGSIHRALDQGSRQRSQSDKVAAAKDALSLLTQREREVLDLLVDGCSNKVAALKLQISPRTVELHRARVMEKLGATNLSGLVRLSLTAQGRV
jgi:two-component system response regulator FixJ